VNHRQNASQPVKKKQVRLLRNMPQINALLKIVAAGALSDKSEPSKGAISKNEA
jgi:hypothetical protein